MWEYFKTECTFSGAEIYVDFELEVDAAAPLHGPHRCPDAAERWWTSQDASDSAKESESCPMARIRHGKTGDDDLRQHFREHETFAGAWVHIQPFSTTITDSSDEDAEEWNSMLYAYHLPMDHGYQYR